MSPVRLASCQETYFKDFPAEGLQRDAGNSDCKSVRSAVSAFRTMRIIQKLRVVTVTRESMNFSASRKI